MNSETTRFLELLERRIGLLGSLADSLLAARADIVGLDIDGLESRISSQEGLCIEIKLLDAQFERLQRQCTVQLTANSQARLAPGSPEGIQRLREALSRLHAAQATVQQLNDAHQILLRRSRRTINALMNSMHSFAMTYSDPAAIRPTIGERV